MRVLLLSLFVASTAMFGQAADGVSVTTDAATYMSGTPVQVTIQNGGPDRITRGGLDCADSWPLALEQLQPDGSWQDVPMPRHACIAIASVLVAPGEAQTGTISLVLDAGSYHVVYAFDDVDNGTQDASISEPFSVTSN
jgi:hypothetical protein